MSGNTSYPVFISDGQFFTWGKNSHGQLGLGKEYPSQASPQRVRSLDGIPLAQVAAGGAHSFALSLSGTSFGWGRNNAGQLALHKNNVSGNKIVIFFAVNHSFFPVGRPALQRGLSMIRAMIPKLCDTLESPGEPP